LDSWQPPKKSEDISNWSLIDGILTMKSAGPSLRTKQTFQDFDLHLEFKLPPKCNTGVYLRGRYEVQLLDSQARKRDGAQFTGVQGCGAIYGQIAPSKDTYRGPNKWNSLDVRLVGETVTVRLNDTLLIDAATLNGPTSAPLDENESDPGPILLQSHSVTGLAFRNITIKPLADATEPPTEDAVLEKPKADAVEKPTAAVESAKEPGVSLFDGETLKGWHGNTSLWKVKDGVIVGNNTSPIKRNTFLISDKKYKDFTLRLKFRLIEGNSGVNVRSKEQENFGISGPQADITGFGFLGSLTGERMEPGIIKKTSEEAQEQLRRNVDLTAWNEMTIVVEGQSVVVKINGQTTVNVISDAIPLNGVIALQLHGGGRTTVEYKDIVIVEGESE